MSLEEFQNDFCSTLSQPGLRVEIAKEWGLKGSSHIERITPAILRRELEQNKDKNIGILGSVTYRDFGTGRAKKEDISQKNYLAFDLDLKESLPESKEWDSAKKRDYIASLFNKHKDGIEACGLGPVWFASFSGNGLHVWFRSNSPLKFDQSKDYEAFYLQCLEKLESVLGLELDRTCKDPNKLMRIPTSINCKDDNKDKEKIHTKVIYHSQEADSSKELHGIWEDTLEQAKVTPLRKPQIKLPHSDDHKERVKTALNTRAILTHWGYSKWDSEIVKNGLPHISAPWRVDSNPSLQIEAHWFKDWADKEKQGDVFNLIALLHGLNIQADFLKILEIGEQITGIPSPKPAKSKKGKGEANGQSQADSEGGLNKIDNREDYYDFFRKFLPDLCKDVLTGQMFFKKKDGSWSVAMNAMPWLRAEASVCLGLNRFEIHDWLVAYGEEEKHVKSRLLVDIPQWDGEDRIQTIAKCVHIKHSTGLTQKDFEEHLKQWGSGIFERLNDNNFQNPLFLLAGNQEQGKDFLIKAMVGKLGKYYHEGSIGRKAEDDYQLMTKALVINLAEFDQTAKVDIGYLKDVIFKPQATFRMPYDRDSEERKFHCSWIASSNETDLLRDPTGNRRFVIFEIEKIDHNYPTDQSLQILAQFRALKGYKVSPEAKDAMARYIKEKTPPTIDEMVLERFYSLWDSPQYKSKIKGQKLFGNDAHNFIDDLAKGTRLTSNKVTKILKDNGMSDKGTRNKREVFLPGNR